MCIRDSFHESSRSTRKVSAREHPVHLRLGVPHDLVVGVRRAMRHRLAVVVGVQVDAIGGVAQHGRVRAQVGVADFVAMRRIRLIRVNVKRGGVVMRGIESLEQRYFIEVQTIRRLSVAVWVAAVPQFKLPLVVQHRAVKIPLEDRLPAVLLLHPSELPRHDAFLGHHPVVHQKLLSKSHAHRFRSHAGGAQQK